METQIKMSEREIERILIRNHFNLSVFFIIKRKEKGLGQRYAHAFNDSAIKKHFKVKITLEIARPFFFSVPLPK